MIFYLENALNLKQLTEHQSQEQSSWKSMLFKGTFTQNVVLFIHPRVVSNPYDFCGKHKKRPFEDCADRSFPCIYNEQELRLLTFKRDIKVPNQNVHIN